MQKLNLNTNVSHFIWLLHFKQALRFLYQQF